MEPKDKKKILIGGTLAGAGVILIFTVLFFTLGPALFGQNASVDSKYAQMFSRVMNFVKNNYVDEVDEQKLFDGAMKGLFESLNDPYSVYLSASDMMNLNDTTTGEFGGLGLYINKLDPAFAEKSNQTKDKYVEVVSPIEDTPAFRAGVLAGDYITKINGEPVDTMTMDKVLQVLRGKPDTDVTITVLRGESTTLDYTLRRAIIEVPTVKSAWIKPGVAYLRISQFAKYTPDKFFAAIEDFKKQKFTKLIIDLRNNPGGLLEAVAKIGSAFFKDGVIVSTKSRVPGETYTFTADGSMAVPEDVQVVVLIDKGSASASEILSGALKDRKRAFLLGDTTYGKGSVQQVIPFDKTGFKLTMARYYTPSGVNIDKVGIAPHKVLKEKELSEDELKEYRKLYESKKLEVFAKTNPTPAATQAFLAELHKSGFALEDRILLRLIHLEMLKQSKNPLPIFDLEYDIQLQEAVRLLEAGPLQIP